MNYCGLTLLKYVEVLGLSLFNQDVSKTHTFHLKIMFYSLQSEILALNAQNNY